MLQGSPCKENEVLGYRVWDLGLPLGLPCGVLREIVPRGFFFSEVANRWMPQFCTMAACVFLSFTQWILCFYQQIWMLLCRGILLFERTQTFIKQNKKHDRKLRHFLSKRSPVSSGSSLTDKWVMNLSSKELSALERSGLVKDLKCAAAPSEIPTAEIVAGV